MSSEALHAVKVYRQLLNAIKKHIGQEDYKKHFGEFVMLEFRKNTNLFDHSAIEQKIKLARDYTFLLNSVHHHKILFSFIALGYDGVKCSTLHA
ncbi:conserved hypothetical protein [Ricinus communis]|uniref:Complex 1 LYR protein domain-containing protein n=1 Tax=Ricinus communis TaxID=3988 RepID=B9SD30_RICCO|nr:conserved hypothetical protein [Ricinus communis]